MTISINRRGREARYIEEMYSKESDNETHEKGNSVGAVGGVKPLE